MADTDDVIKRDEDGGREFVEGSCQETRGVDRNHNGIPELLRDTKTCDHPSVGGDDVEGVENREGVHGLASVVEAIKDTLIRGILTELLFGRFGSKYTSEEGVEEESRKFDEKSSQEQTKE